MMRKVLLLLILLLLIFIPLYAADGDTSGTTTGTSESTKTADTSKFIPVENSVRIAVTVRNRVYVGVTKNAVSSSIIPSASERIGTEKKPITFSFDPYTKTWNTENAYIYAISFVTQKVKITLTPAQLKSSSGDVLPYTLDLVTASTNCSGTSGLNVTSSSTSSSELAPITIADESSASAEYRKKPRVMTWQLKMQIDADANASKTTSEYTATFIMTLSATT